MAHSLTMESLADLIRKSQPPQGMQTRVISIDGCGGAGKSTLAARISSALRGCPVVHTDDFASWDNPLNWFPRLIEQVLVPLSNNQLPRFQRFDWNTRTLSEWMTLPSSEFVIIEGVSSLRREFRRYLSFGIFVKTPAEIRLRRGLERDGQEAKEQWLKWMAEEDRYIKGDDPEGFANIVVDGQGNSQNSVSVFR